MEGRSKEFWEKLKSLIREYGDINFATIYTLLDLARNRMLKDIWIEDEDD